jgi:hypothetical protein
MNLLVNSCSNFNIVTETLQSGLSCQKEPNSSLDLMVLRPGFEPGSAAFSKRLRFERPSYLTGLYYRSVMTTEIVSALNFWCSKIVPQKIKNGGNLLVFSVFFRHPARRLFFLRLRSSNHIVNSYDHGCNFGG